MPENELTNRNRPDHESRAANRQLQDTLAPHQPGDQRGQARIRSKQISERCEYSLLSTLWLIVHYNRHEFQFQPQFRPARSKPLGEFLRINQRTDALCMAAS